MRVRLKDAWRMAPADGVSTFALLAELGGGRVQGVGATRIVTAADGALELHHHRHALVTAWPDGTVRVAPFASVTSAARVRRFSPVHVHWSDGGRFAGYRYAFTWHGVEYVTNGAFTLHPDGTVTDAERLDVVREARADARRMAMKGRREARATVRALLADGGATDVRIWCDAVEMDGTDAMAVLGVRWTGGPSWHAVNAELEPYSGAVWLDGYRTPIGAVAVAAALQNYSGTIGTRAADLVAGGGEPCPAAWLADPRVAPLAAVTAGCTLERVARLVYRYAGTDVARVPADAVPLFTALLADMDPVDAAAVVLAMDAAA